MPRIRIGPRFEISYQSPNDMVAHLGEALKECKLFIETSSAVEAGGEREILFHVPWLNQDLRLRGRVLRLARETEPPGFYLRLLDGSHDSLEKLRGVVGKIRSGAILEEASAEASAGQRIRSMSPSLRALLAAKASAEERLVLARDPDPRVIDFLLKNPSLTLEEVRRLAGRLALNQAHFTLIIRNPVWMGDELMRNTLARNPRLPEFMAESVLVGLSSAVLRNLVESMNTTAATRRVASRVLQTRGIVVSARKGMA